MRRRSAVGLAALVTVATAATGYALDGSADAANTLGPGLVTVEIDIEHSRFSTDRVDVHQGTLVRFVVRNTDPINHELIVGDDDVHARHAEGSELSHPPVPGEVSVGPGESGVTTYLFDEPGRVVFACHLPGHVDFGMEGEVRVARGGP